MSGHIYLRVKVEFYNPQKDEAYAKVRYVQDKDNVKWLPVVLKKTSLVDLDLHEGDVFLWIPQRDGVVRAKHIKEHPRRADPEESARTKEAFNALERLVKSFNH